MKRSGSTPTVSCGSKSLSPWPTGSVRICTSPQRWCSTTAAMSGLTGFVIGERCATTSPSTRSVAAGIWTRPGQSPRLRSASSTSCATATYLVWISTLVTSLHVSWTLRVIRSGRRSPSPSTRQVCVPRGVMGGSGPRSPRCSTSPSTTVAPRSWWRTSISLILVAPAARHWAVAAAGSGYGVLSPVSPRPSSDAGSPRWLRAAVLRSSAWTPPTPACGGVSIGVNPCHNRLPTRPLSPSITVRRLRSADVDSANRSGVDRQDPRPNSGCVRALHRPDLTSRRAPHDSAVVLAHRRAHNDDEACRSTREHPPPAANTVRAAQDSLLLTNQERLQSRGGRARRADPLCHHWVMVATVAVAGTTFALELIAIRGIACDRAIAQRKGEYGAEHRPYLLDRPGLNRPSSSPTRL